MKTLAAMLVAAALAGCATAPRPQNHVVHYKHISTPKVVAAPAIVADPTPNQIIKHRWYDRFLRHKPSK